MSTDTKARPKRRNQYPGTCIADGCGQRVPPNGGFIEKDVTGWTVIHERCAEAKAQPTSHLDGGPLMPSYNEIQAARKSRPSWAEVLEANEWFDGEPEITAAAKAAWLDGRYDR